MSYRLSFLSILLMAAFGAQAQVQVRNEPRHKNVFENKYFRVLDVNIPPHDTTLQHIHSTPSVILLFTNTVTAQQLKGQAWVKSQSVAGSAFYRDFAKDTVIHKVSNWDTAPYHVTDIELLSTYEPNSSRKPLPFTVLFDSDRAFAYRVTDSSINKQTISNRGPMIAGLVAGDDVILHDTKNHRSINIKPGKETYIEPGTSFYLTTTSKKEINLVLFELK
ncbi:hypothetical protein [Mucilaginibacter sp. BT774]|uniref:hypothetical protein n=1 Tax=Mucilaginibacter sp. BT774 TaxID=3062276 RepID=UPI0026757923|nr:hypothetical protein [Mucilaginibacter sp. BT774]MDO3625639.1 hypothetical protein [Mucilaginibacter sp. BT774]